MDTITYLAPNGAALLLGLLGIAALCFPKTMAGFVGLAPIEPLGMSEIRSTLGSFFLGLCVACLWLQSPDAFTVLGVASLTAAVVRFLSSWFDRSISIKNWGGVAVEALLGVLFLLNQN